MTTVVKKQVSFRQDAKDHNSNNNDSNNNDVSAAVSWNMSSKSTSSEGSSNSHSSSSGGSSTSVIPSLGERLIRTQTHRDPMRYYEVVQQLGSGSMGSVHLVRKRTFGGSARRSFVRREHSTCWRFPWPCGGFCLPKSRKSALSRQNNYHKQSSSIVSFGTSVPVDFALKTILLRKCRNDSYKQELLHEIAVLRSLDHPNIVRAVETYDYHHKLYLVLELCHGGDLYERDPYTEPQAKSIVYTLLDAIAYLHSKNITHRDLKYENIMFASPTSNTIKIIDFGLSKKYGQEENENDDDNNPQGMMKEFVGTLYTMAPEVIRGNYTEKCDVWSIGVLAFMLLSSCFPFFGENDKEIATKIVGNQWDFWDDERWKGIGGDAKGFVKRILTLDAATRPSATNAMENGWFDSLRDKDQNVLPISDAVMDRVQATIQTFAGYSILKKLALLVIAHQSIDEEIGFLRRLFLQRFDTEKANANVSFPEFKEALKEHYNYSDDELWTMFCGMDIDGTNKVSFTEFLAASIEAHGLIEEERIAEAFDRIDCDDSGYITVDNLRDVLGDEVDDDFIDELVNQVKTTGDEEEDRHNIISYEDFLGLWDSNGDETLRRNLLDVQRRRRTTSESPRTVMASSQDKHSTARTPDQSAEGSTKHGMGYSQFEKEKAKSRRGVWMSIRQPTGT
ncbi:MAP kinase-activated protein kinase 2 (Fragment) [Seminavis robusta]|uniref:MAP kinase-activated protein kinase 2 n=1 Tax=Seminavis robusta TaxID=568900 RepID=A0A9N8E5F6_9STRA